MPIEMPQIKKLVDSKSAPLTMTKPVKKFEEKLTEELASINIQKDVSPSAPQQNNANQTTILAAEKVNGQAATTTTTVMPPELNTQNKPQKSESANIQKLHGEYGILLVQEISKYKQYPVFARQNRQQGLVILEIRMNDLGQLASVKVYRSSNHAALDKQAISGCLCFSLPSASVRGCPHLLSPPVELPSLGASHSCCRSPGRAGQR